MDIPLSRRTEQKLWRQATPIQKVAFMIHCYETYSLINEYNIRKPTKQLFAELSDAEFQEIVNQCKTVPWTRARYSLADADRDIDLYGFKNNKYVLRIIERLQTLKTNCQSNEINPYVIEISQVNMHDD